MPKHVLFDKNLYLKVFIRHDKEYPEKDILFEHYDTRMYRLSYDLRYDFDSFSDKDSDKSVHANASLLSFGQGYDPE